MARLDALSIELIAGGKDKLAEEYGKVIDKFINEVHIPQADEIN